LLVNRPDLEAVLKPLKPFQRRTVEHAFHRLFVADDSTARFLVADEVGLGKTLVARGIIAKAVDRLWDSVPRIDVVYICSNASIAGANLPKLQVGGAGERSFSLATRLTMLATELAPRPGKLALSNSKLNFVSFTPGTSFELGRSSGQSTEREVLFHLLAPEVASTTPLMNLLQGHIKNPERWRNRLKNKIPLEPSIEHRFHAAFKKETALKGAFHQTLDKWFGRYREDPPWEARRERADVTGRLRMLLARVCVQSLEPDLVILDEFQRFKSLLDARPEHRDPAAELAQALFSTLTPEGKRVRTLLLSATPYKLYTADAEIEHEDHYADFLATTRFLMNDDESRVDALKEQLSRFGTALKRAASGDASVVAHAKTQVENSLRAVMARTERVAASEDRDAMVLERKAETRLEPHDVEQYLAADALFRVLGDRDPMQFWKSAPYLLHFMHGYKINERIDEAVESKNEKVSQVIRAHGDAFLRARRLRKWLAVEAGNPKLRDIARDLFDDAGLWRLLWLPPTLPYWPLEGPFRGTEGATKRLLFSAWNVVPDVVSGLLSYEADRRMAGGRLKSYNDPALQQVPLLRLSDGAAGGRSRHRLLLLLMPCLTLADEAHPLEAPAGRDRREWVRERVGALLARLPDPQSGDIDDRWEWAAPLLLDSGLADFLAAWRDRPEIPKPNEEVFKAYADDILSVQQQILGRRPPHLADLLTDVALGSPAVCAARALLSASIKLPERRRLSVVIGHALWRLFNRPTVITLLNQLGSELPESEREEAYWRRVLLYCQHGNLQAVLDEQWHMLWEQEAWSEKETRESIASKCATKLAQAAAPAPSRVHARFLHPARDGGLRTREVRVRTDLALRFGDALTDEGQVSRDMMRAAFNSPFRPFVLASTSVGQEGLDFHPWCHRLVHWNLPGNPVDLEQREGRVHRYKCHAVRHNVAAANGLAALARFRKGDDLWTHIFDIATTAARATGESDLVPHWIAPGPCRIERYVPNLPYTREVQAFERLKRQLAAYRVVFGQPRQEELMVLLEKAELSLANLREWSVDLSPLT
jgi:hypothetical protein